MDDGTDLFCLFMDVLLVGVSRHRGAHSLHRVRGWVRDTHDVVFVHEAVDHGAVAATERPRLRARGGGGQLGEAAVVDGVGDDQGAVVIGEEGEELAGEGASLGVVSGGAQVARVREVGFVLRTGQDGASGVAGLVDAHPAEEGLQRDGVVGVGTVFLDPGDEDVLKYVVDGDRVPAREDARDGAPRPAGEGRLDLGEGRERRAGGERRSVHRGLLAARAGGAVGVSSRGVSRRLRG
ncbi:MAG: hypothetical protein R3A52_25070 [Polyangiales bacterium]